MAVWCPLCGGSPGTTMSSERRPKIVRQTLRQSALSRLKFVDPAEGQFYKGFVRYAALGRVCTGR